NRRRAVRECHRVRVAVQRFIDDGEVVARADRCSRNVVFDGQRQRALEQDASLLETIPPNQKGSLRRERLRQDFIKPERLCELELWRRGFRLAAEGKETPELTRDGGDVGTVLFPCKRLECVLEPGDRIGGVAVAVIDLGDDRGCSRSRMSEALGVEDLERLAE